MHRLFGLPSPVSVGVFKAPEWQYVREGLQRSLETVHRYNRRNPTAVNSAHFLVRLIQSVSIPISQPLDRFYDNVTALGLSVSVSMRMTSSINRGSLFKGTFYGQGNDEILVAHATDFDALHAHKNWQDLTPVEVLRHPFSDLGLAIPDGKVHSVEHGLAVIAINVPLLSVMYRAFRLNEEEVSENESQRSIMHFVRMYVLPNMLQSHLDQAVFNRMDNLVKGAPMGESDFKHPFYLTDYSSRATYIQATLLDKLMRDGRDFGGILRTIPAVTKDNMEQTMLLPDMAPTRQVLWALMLSRLNVLLFLYRASRGGPQIRNQLEMNQIRRSILQYRSERILQEVLPDDLYYDTESELQYLMDVR